MLAASIDSIFARIVHGAVLSMRAYRRSRRNALAVRHLEALPDYLRRDMGLPDNIDIVDVVEHGLEPRADGDPRRALAVMPRAA